MRRQGRAMAIGFLAGGVLFVAVAAVALWGSGSSLAILESGPETGQEAPAREAGTGHAERRLREVMFDLDPSLLDTVRGDGERFLVVLIPYDRTRFFLNEGRPRGFEYDLVQAYRDHVNERRGPGEPELETVFIPTAFAELVPLLASGVGDIAAGGLTVTEARAEQVDFSAPYFEDVSEIVVAHGPSGLADSISAPEDLAGRTVMVPEGTSYIDHLEALNERLEADGLDPVEISVADPVLMSEDILEMVNAGIVPLAVIDDHLARLWAQVLPDIALLEEAAVHEGGAIAWAIRPGAADLKASIDAFMDEVRKGTLLGNILFERYYEDTRWVTNPLSEEGLADLARYRSLFEAYAAQYGFDWRMIAALAYHESRFDQNAQGSQGAVGLMQIKPETAKAMGFDDVSGVEANIHAGVRYLAHLRDEYFSDPAIPEDERVRFALAAYNAGPTRIAELRRMAAEEMRLDPNRWFFNVERAAAKAIGRTPVRYVSNISKYFMAYSLGEALLEDRQRERDTRPASPEGADTRG